MKKNQTYFLKDIMEVVKSEELDDDFCLYAKENGELNFQDSYLLADYPQVVDNKDVYPRQVREQELELIYYGEDFADVMSMMISWILIKIQFCRKNFYKQ